MKIVLVCPRGIRYKKIYLTGLVEVLKRLFTNTFLYVHFYNITCFRLKTRIIKINIKSKRTKCLKNSLLIKTKLQRVNQIDT